MTGTYIIQSVAFLKKFPYKASDKADKPSAINGTGEVKQTFSKMWCMFHLIPFMVGEKVPENDQVWKLYLLLSTVVEYLCSPSIKAEQIEAVRLLLNRKRSGHINL